jgi:hypothetical protein
VAKPLQVGKEKSFFNSLCFGGGGGLHSLTPLRCTCQLKRIAIPS